MENQTEKKIKVLRIDNGGEFCSKEFKEFYKKFGISRYKTTPCTPQQNGVAERMNKTLKESARSMFSGAGLGQEFCVEVVDTTCYLGNRSPSLALEDKTPQEVWTGKKPSLSHLRVFGCDAYVHVPKEKQTKLDSKSENCIFIGYKDGLKGYKLWNPVTKGYSQVSRIDFGDIFSLVAKVTSIRLLLSVAAAFDFEVEQMDVKTIFLHGDLEEEIYMKQPEGFVVKGKKELVCKLKKSLYRLKQSPRMWYQKFDTFI